MSSKYSYNIVRVMSILCSGMLGKVLVVLLIAGLAWAFPSLQPPPPRICGSPNGPIVTGPRIKLRDERYLAYKEHGVPKETAKYKVVYAHSFSATKYDSAVAPLVCHQLFVKIVLMHHF